MVTLKEICQVQDILKEAALFKGRLSIEDAVIRVIKNQQAIMAVLFTIMEDIKDRKS